MAKDGGRSRYLPPLMHPSSSAPAVSTGFNQVLELEQSIQRDLETAKKAKEDAYWEMVAETRHARAEGSPFAELAETATDFLIGRNPDEIKMNIAFEALGAGAGKVIASLSPIALQRGRNLWQSFRRLFSIGDDVADDVGAGALAELSELIGERSHITYGDLAPGSRFEMPTFHADPDHYVNLLRRRGYDEAQARRIQQRLEYEYLADDAGDRVPGLVDPLEADYVNNIRERFREMQFGGNTDELREFLRQAGATDDEIRHYVRGDVDDRIRQHFAESEAPYHPDDFGAAERAGMSQDEYNMAMEDYFEREWEAQNGLSSSGGLYPGEVPPYNPAMVARREAFVSEGGSLRQLNLREREMDIFDAPEFKAARRDYAYVPADDLFPVSKITNDDELNSLLNRMSNKMQKDGQVAANEKYWDYEPRPGTRRFVRISGAHVTIDDLNYQKLGVPKKAIDSFIEQYGNNLQGDPGERIVEVIQQFAGPKNYDQVLKDIAGAKSHIHYSLTASQGDRPLMASFLYEAPKGKSRATSLARSIHEVLPRATIISNNESLSADSYMILHNAARHGQKPRNAKRYQVSDKWVDKPDFNTMARADSDLRDLINYRGVPLDRGKALKMLDNMRKQYNIRGYTRDIRGGSEIVVEDLKGQLPAFIKKAYGFGGAGLLGAETWGNASSLLDDE